MKKLVISVPDDTFERTERLAQATGRTRSELYSTAMAQYLARHEPDSVTEMLNEVIADVGRPDDGFVASAASRTLEDAEW